MRGRYACCCTIWGVRTAPRSSASSKARDGAMITSPSVPPAPCPRSGWTTAVRLRNPFERAKVQQWLHFEQERVESVIGSLRYWTLTGKLAQRPPALVEMKRKGALRTLAILERELAARSFLANDRYSIADMSVFAYASRAEEAGISLEPYPHLRAWIARVQVQPGFLAAMHSYSEDPHSAGELP